MAALYHATSLIFATKPVGERYTVQVTVEGELRPELVEELRHDLTRKLETLEQSPMVCQGIPAE